MLKLAMLSTGEEVLHGDITDTNAAWLSSLFFEHGYGLSKRSTVGDSRSALLQELLMLTLNSDVLVVNGGLGPTTDDLTTEVAAELADVELELYPEWLETLEAFFAQRQQPMPQSNIKQAMLPKGSQLIDNPIGTACGFRLVINDCVCYFTPGVPSEFKRMVAEQIIPDLKQTFPQITGQDCHRIYTLGSSESELAHLLDPLVLPEGYQLGYRSYIPFIEIKVFGPKGDEQGALAVVTAIRDRVENSIVSIDQPMLNRFADCLYKANFTLSVAEQSTHGWLSQWLFSNDKVAGLRGNSWILSSQVSGEMDSQDSLSAVLALAGATREKSATHLAIATGVLNQREFSIAISTPSGEWAQVLSFSRDYSHQDSRVVIGTIVSDMLLRYLCGNKVFGLYRSAKAVKQIHLPAELAQA